MDLHGMISVDPYGLENRQADPDRAKFALPASNPSRFPPQQRLHAALTTVFDNVPHHQLHPTAAAAADAEAHDAFGGPAEKTPTLSPYYPDTTAKISLQQNPHHPAVAAGGVVTNGNASALSTPRQMPPAPTPATPVMPSGEPGSLQAPPEGIYRSFEDLLNAVQRVAKEQGYGVVKLRASNYRDGKPTRYDLVCDRGGVKYNSTAKKRNPSTRKIDCPWRAKAVCEVQLNNQWRFAVQDSRHNHEARTNAATPGQESAPTAQSFRTLTNKLDRISHDLSQGFMGINQRIDGLEKRMESMEARLNTVDARMSGMDTRGPGMEVPMDNMEMEGSMLGASVM